MERQKISKTGCLENPREDGKSTLVVRTLQLQQVVQVRSQSVLPEWILWVMVGAGRWMLLKLVTVGLGDHKMYGQVKT